MNDDWLSFASEVAFLKSPVPPADEMCSIYRTRESYVESLFEGIILLPVRLVASELRRPTFGFVPDDFNRRLIKHTKTNFLGLCVRRFGKLSCGGRHVYTDGPTRKVAATRMKVTDSFQQESEIKLRTDILTAYCDHKRFAAFWVMDTLRFSERPPEEFDFPIGRTDAPGSTFCYFHHFDACGQPSRRVRMKSVFLLCGKRLLTSQPT